MTSNSPPRGRIGRMLSWGVHLLTASGGVLGLFALVCIATQRLELAVLLMLASLVVDSIDGTLARAVRVTEHLPQIDGRRLDDIVDYLNFVIVPSFFMWAAGSVVHVGWLSAPVLASAVGLARVDAKTEDNFFLGFPSYWNILAIFLWLMGMQPVAGTIWVVALSIAVFVPIKYLYPSKVQPLSLRFWLGVGACIWTAVLVACVLWPAQTSAYFLIEASLAYPAWYLLLSFKRGGLFRGRKRIASRNQTSSLRGAP
ncbi:MAG: CDP-alcohol phosphatidyltransferase family protein [Deltaproteobacteria bacterium]|nr:CDP-alcohol phosphatidyltransferase family protein [Deltaproteobacteria bacterium]